MSQDSRDKENDASSALEPGPTTPLVENPTESVLLGLHTYRSVTDHISDLVTERPISISWLLAMGLAAVLTGYLVAGIVVLLAVGVGIWGIQIPTAWGIAIISYIWWIEIAMGGTFVSTALYVAHQPWRTSINRFAECMMLSAWVLAGLYPLMHMGRPWFWYWLAPYPDTMNLYPQFRSALIWDVVALSCYGAVSLLFFLVGLIPDLASIRDRTNSHWKKRTYGALALGWRGSARQWAAHRKAYMLMAGLIAPIVFTVHSVVGLDLATTLLHGWHDPFMPPYFVAEAVMQGVACALVLGVPLRHLFKLQQLITPKHLDNLCKLILIPALILAWTYFMEAFMSYYGDKSSEINQMQYRLFGEYAQLFWLSVFCICIQTQLLWFKRIRTSDIAVFAISLLVLFGIWIERFWVVVNGTANPYLHSMKRVYHGTFWDYSILAGTVGFFLLIFLVYMRVLPSVATSELRELVYAEGKLLDPTEERKPEREP